MKKIIMVVTMAMACGASSAAWEYDSGTDKMTGEKTINASVASDNELSFKFPYQGLNLGLIMVKRHPQDGLGVIVMIKKGQIICNGDDCDVSVKFDDGKPVNYGGTSPADHSSNGIFLKNAPKFIAGAKKAKKILIEFNAFENGSPILEFSTPHPLEWPPK